MKSNSGGSLLRESTAISSSGCADIFVRSPKKKPALFLIPAVPPKDGKYDFVVDLCSLDRSLPPEEETEIGPLDVFYPSEFRCPNCDLATSDLICRCGVTIQPPELGDPSCN